MTLPYQKETDDGLDPLTDVGLNAVASVLSHYLYTISEKEAGRPELISYYVFGSVDYWKELMSYNGICDVRTLKNGTTIRIPNRSEFMDAINKKEYAFVDRSVRV